MRHCFFDECVYRIVIDIVIQRLLEFGNTLILLGRFQMAKVVELYIEKFFKGSSTEDAVVETNQFGVKVVA